LKKKKSQAKQREAAEIDVSFFFLVAEVNFYQLSIFDKLARFYKQQQPLSSYESTLTFPSVLLTSANSN